MFKFLLLFTLLIFLVIFLLGGFTALAVFKRIMKAGRQQAGRAGRHGQYGRRSSDKAGVIDRRPTEERDKKIFPKDEGDYVDFE